MKTIRLFFLAGMVPLFSGAQLSAAPLTWFPGPAIDTPVSGEAAVVSGGKNIVIGGDSYYAPYSYPQSLAATNLYWSYLSPLYSVNIAGGAVVSDGMIIVYGGTDGTTSLNTVIDYSLSGDTVPTPKPMSVARAYLGYAPDKNGNAYAFGGLDANNNPLASAERYNPGNNIWTAIASLPAARYDFPAVFNRTNYIYIFGGITDPVSGTEIANVLRYAVSSNTWTAMAALPVAVAGSAATLGPDGKIYVIGGTSGGVATDVVQVYDPVANSWSLSTPLPEALSLAAAGVDSLGRLIVMGGMDINGNDVGDVWRSQLLTSPDTVPVLVSYPALGATYQVPYSSSITATGNPQPTYVLVTGPAGMQVDAFSGAINWTPSASEIGSNAVTIRATNFAGYVDWNFNLTVPNPPPTLVSNLTVVSVTENSVTLAWDPESPLVGPTTYGVYLRHVSHSPRGSGATVWYTQIGSSTTVPTITIAGLAAGFSQIYFVAASAPGGTSGYEGIAATTLGPQPPTNLRVTGITSTSVTLAWDPSPGPIPVVRYEIWGWINNGVNYASYGTNFTGTTATITGLTPGTWYEWGVRGYDAEGYASGFDYGPTAVNPVPAAAKLAGIGSPPPTAGGFQFAVQASAVQTTLIQATANIGDPASWVTIATNPPSSAFIFTDTNSSQFSRRYYRVVSP